MDSAALSEFYYAHIEKIYQFFFYKVLNREVAEDLTGQTFLQFVRKCQQSAPAKPKSFLFGIAKHVFLDYLRAKYKKTEVSLDDEFADEDFEAPSVNIRDLLEQVISQVPEKQRIILQLRFLEGCSIPETATKLDKTEKYVSQMQYRGLQTVKEILKCRDDATNITEKNYEFTK